MFFHMRRAERAMTDAEAMELLQKGEVGILSLFQNNGYTSGIPLNYVVVGDTIYFHGASAGNKMQAVRFHPHVSFTVIGSMNIAWNELDTFFTSAIAYGTARVLEDPQEIRTAMLALGKKFSPDLKDAMIVQAIEKYLGKFSVIALKIEHITAKKAQPG